MKYILLVLFIGVVAFSSCDGRQTKQEALKQSVTKFKNSIKTTQIIEYFPSEYAEVQTDTMLSNGYRVKIKNFTSMTASVLEKATSKNSNYKHYFRQIESEIIVYKNDKLIFSALMDEDFFSRYISNNITFDAYLNSGITINELKSLEENKLVLESSFRKPKSTISSSYLIIIDEKGVLNFKTTDYHART